MSIAQSLTSHKALYFVKPVNIHKPAKGSTGFTRILNDAINDEQLSLEQLGLLVYLQSRNEYWQVRVGDIARRNKCSYRKAQRLIDSLVQLGYMTREGKGRRHLIYKVFAAPQPVSNTTKSTVLIGQNQHSNRTPVSSLIRNTNKEKSTKKEVDSCFDLPRYTIPPLAVSIAERSEQSDVRGNKTSSPHERLISQYGEAAVRKAAESMFRKTADKVTWGKSMPTPKHWREFPPDWRGCLTGAEARAIDKQIDATGLGLSAGTDEVFWRYVEFQLAFAEAA